jgi:glutathione S-transferase
MLEELGLQNKVIPVNIRAGEQFRPEFRRNMFGQRAKELAGRR